MNNLNADTNGEGIDESNQLSDKIVTIHQMLSNNILQSTRYSRLSSLNTWLVNIYQIFVYDNYTSTVGTYLQSNISQQERVSTFDQTLFYVLVNA